MGSEWRRTTLGEVVQFTSGGTPSKSNEAYWLGSIPWVSAKDMKTFRLFDVEDHISEEGLNSGSRLAPTGAVLVLTRGMTLLNDLPICVLQRPMAFNQDVKALIPKPGLCPEFLPYLLLAHKDRLLESVDLAGHGTGRLNTDELKLLDIFLPLESEQKRIAHILGTLDDKIELNRQMNKTLEEMARALFKSWFVDFDPVRAKMEGRWTRDNPLPGLPTHLFDLFPDHFVDSELGEIPAGWTVGCLGDEFIITMGQSPPGSTYNEDGDGIPFFQGRSDFGFRYPQNRVFCTSPTRFAAVGDVLVSVRAPVGDINIAVERCCVGRGVAAVRHRSGVSSYSYYKMASIRPVFLDFDREGTVFGAINKEAFNGLLSVVVPDPVVESFEGTVSSIEQRLLQNEIESRGLAEVRHGLLGEFFE